MLDIVVRNAATEFRRRPATLQLTADNDDNDIDALLFAFKAYVSDVPFHFHWRLRRQSDDTVNS